MRAGLHALWRGQRIKLLHVVDPATVPTTATDRLPRDAAPGTLLYERSLDALCVRCRDAWLLVDRVLVEGRHAVSARQFAVGYKLSGSAQRWE